jgi:cytochrome c oxidase subunit 2
MGPKLQARRLWLKGVAATIAASLVAALASKVAAGEGESETIVKVVARRFHYEPAEISLNAGQAAVLEITSLDFVHGFKIPDLNMRADLPPGRVTKVRVKFDQPGNYAFLCDNFCGDDHEEMAGKFVVI